MDEKALFILIFFPVVIIYYYYRGKRAKKIAIRYLKKNELTILKIDRKFSLFVPQFLRSTTQQVWLYAEMRNKNGEILKAYIKVGHWIYGLLDPTVTIYWEDR